MEIISDHSILSAWEIDLESAKPRKISTKEIEDICKIYSKEGGEINICEDRLIKTIDIYYSIQYVT